MTKRECVPLYFLSAVASIWISAAIYLHSQVLFCSGAPDFNPSPFAFSTSCSFVLLLLQNVKLCLICFADLRALAEVLLASMFNRTCSLKQNYNTGSWVVDYTQFTLTMCSFQYSVRTCTWCAMFHVKRVSTCSYGMTYNR